jgi:hypothetical protein
MSFREVALPSARYPCSAVNPLELQVLVLLSGVANGGDGPATVRPAPAAPLTTLSAVGQVRQPAPVRAANG